MTLVGSPYEYFHVHYNSQTKEDHNGLIWCTFNSMREGNCISCYTLVHSRTYSMPWKHNSERVAGVNTMLSLHRSHQNHHQFNLMTLTSKCKPSKDSHPHGIPLNDNDDQTFHLPPSFPFNNKKHLHTKHIYIVGPSIVPFNDKEDQHQMLHESRLFKCRWAHSQRTQDEHRGQGGTMFIQKTNGQFYMETEAMPSNHPRVPGSQVLAHNPSSGTTTLSICSSASHFLLIWSHWSNR